MWFALFVSCRRPDLRCGLGATPAFCGAGHASRIALDRRFACPLASPALFGTPPWNMPQLRTRACMAVCAPRHCCASVVERHLCNGPARLGRRAAAQGVRARQRRGARGRRRGQARRMSVSLHPGRGQNVVCARTHTRVRIPRQPGVVCHGRAAATHHPPGEATPARPPASAGRALCPCLHNSGPARGLAAPAAPAPDRCDLARGPGLSRGHMPARPAPCAAGAWALGTSTGTRGRRRPPRSSHAVPRRRRRRAAARGVARRPGAVGQKCTLLVDVARFLRLRQGASRHVKARQGASRRVKARQGASRRRASPRRTAKGSLQRQLGSPRYKYAWEPCLLRAWNVNLLTFEPPWLSWQSARLVSVRS
jgi:hypothetical protein